jgi:hypothetical protein
MHLSAYIIGGMPNRPYREIEGYFETALKGEVVSYEGKA